MTNFKSEVIINGVSNLVESEKTESAFWKEVALLMYNQDYPVPATIQVISEDGKKAEVQISKLEKYTSKEDKISIDLVDDELFLPESHYGERMLRRIDSEKDIRSRYDMRPNNMGPITINIGAISGQIGRKGVDRLEDGVVHKPFRSQLYWLRYYEKLSSGYKDYTESLKADEDESKIAKFFAKPSEEEMVEDSIQELYKMLTGAAKSNLLESGIALDFYSDEAPYTRRQVTSARKLYLKMCAVEFASEMNELIEDFVAIAAPKYQKGTKVQDFLVDIVDDPEEQLKLMGEKLDWVNSIVSSMETVVTMKKNKDVVYESPFGNIQMTKLTDDEMHEFIQKEIPRINPRQRDDIISIFDVTPVEQKEKYEKYLDSSTFGKKESLLFHGSPTCNWVSIIQNGLLLNPNAAICGKAFGNGIYFAPDSDKSAGYMSNRGSRWRNGGDDIVVMGIYRVATGNPYYGTQIIGGAPEKTKELKEMFQEKGYDSFWYKAGTGSFVRDEVIIYEEEACVLDKLIIMSLN